MCKPMSDDDDYLYDVYHGQKKTEMPNIPTASLSPNLQMKMDVSRKRADENDFAFFHDIVAQEGCPEFNGYNTQLCR